VVGRAEICTDDDPILMGLTKICTVDVKALLSNAELGALGGTGAADDVILMGTGERGSKRTN